MKYSGRVYFVAGLFALRNHDISRAVFVRLRSYRDAWTWGIAFVHGEMDVASALYYTLYGSDASRCATPGGASDVMQRKI